MSRFTQGRVCVVRCAALTALTTVLLARAPATATEAASEQAEQLLHKGIALFSDGEFVRSRGVLQQAMEKTQRPQLLAKIQLHMGLNHASENQPAAARNAFRAALSHDRRLQIDPRRYKQDYVRLFQEARRSMQGELVVIVDPPGAEVMLDGEMVGKAPYRGRAFQGTYTVELQGVGATPTHARRVDVKAGQVTRTAIVLEIATRDARTAQHVDATDSRKRRRLWTWIAAGGAVASAAVAIGLGVSAGADHDAGCDLLAGPMLSCEERTQLNNPEEDREPYDDLRTSVSAKTLAANIAWGTAGALAVTAVVLFFVEGRSDGQTETQTVKLLPQVGQFTGMHVQLTY